MVGMSDMAATEGSAPVFPYELTLRSAQEVLFPCSDLSAALGNFGKLKKDDVLFKVLATEAPGGTPQEIGEFILTGQFTTSAFGDSQLFFKHQYMEDDFALRPDWLNSIDRKTECGMGCTG